MISSYSLDFIWLLVSVLILIQTDMAIHAWINWWYLWIWIYYFIFIILIQYNLLHNRYIWFEISRWITFSRAAVNLLILLVYGRWIISVYIDRTLNSSWPIVDIFNFHCSIQLLRWWLFGTTFSPIKCFYVEWERSRSVCVFEISLLALISYWNALRVLFTFIIINISFIWIYFIWNSWLCFSIFW